MCEEDVMEWKFYESRRNLVALRGVIGPCARDGANLGLLSLSFAPALLFFLLTLREKLRKFLNLISSTFNRFV